MSTGKITGLSLLCILILGIGYIIYLMNTPDFQVGDVVKNPPKQYKNIFSLNTQKHLLLTYAFKPKYDSVICQYEYKHMFIIQEFSFCMTNDKPLNEIIEVENKDDLDFANTTSNEIRGDLFSVSYKNIFPAVSNLKLSLYGDPIQTVTNNDSIVAYSSTVKNFSVKHEGSNKSAIFLRIGTYVNPNKSLPSHIPVNVLFFKKKKQIFFLMMSVKYPGTKLEPDLLSSLIVDEKKS